MFNTSTLGASEIEEITGGRRLFSMEEIEASLTLPSGQRPRIYAYLERGESAGQVTRLASLHHLDRHREDVGFMWVSTTTIADLVRRA